MCEEDRGHGDGQEDEQVVEAHAEGLREEDEEAIDRWEEAQQRGIPQDEQEEHARLGDEPHLLPLEHLIMNRGLNIQFDISLTWVAQKHGFNTGLTSFSMVLTCFNMVERRFSS